MGCITTVSRWLSAKGDTRSGSVPTASVARLPGIRSGPVLHVVALALASAPCASPFRRRLVHLRRVPSALSRLRFFFFFFFFSSRSRRALCDLARFHGRRPKALTKHLNFPNTRISSERAQVPMQGCNRHLKFAPLCTLRMRHLP